MKKIGSRGAMLIDALLAVLILSCGLLAVSGLFYQTGQAGRILRGHEHAACWAMEGMERLRHYGSLEWTLSNLTDAADEAEQELDGVQMNRTTVLRERPDLDPAGKLVEAEVSVSWTENSQPQQYVLITYFVLDTEMAGLR